MRRCAAITLLALLSIAGSVVAADAPIYFVADKDYPPICWLDNGVPKGMVVDLTRALAKPLNRQTHIDLMDWNVAQKKVLDSEADVVGPMARSRQREQIYDFTQACLTCEYSLFVRENEVGIHDISDLPGKRVGVTPGGYPRQILSEKNGIELVLVENYLNGLQLLQQGKIHALAADRWVAAYYINERGVEGVTVAGEPFATSELAYAVRKGNTALLTALDQALGELKAQGTADTIADNWKPKRVVIYTQEQMRREFLVTAGVIIGILIVALVVWIYLLRRQIRQRLMAERSLRESEARFRTLVEEAPDAIAVFDADTHRYVDANAKAEQMFGCSRNEILQSGPERFFDTTDSENKLIDDSVKQNIERVFTGGEFISERALKNDAGKGRFFEVRGVRFPSDKRRLIRLSFIEITARKKAEAELEKYRDQLETLVQERTQALEKEIAERKRIEEALRLAKDGAVAASDAKSRFLASMSHEIRTPLNAILGYSHLLSRDKTISRNHAQALSSISRSGEHLLDLLSDILVMSSIEAGRTTLDEIAFDLHELLRSLESMFGLRVQEKGLLLRAELGSSLPRHIHGDQRKLRQILFNLLSNAVRFTERGTVTLRARAKPIGAAGNVALEFEVEDTGPGMTYSEQEALFAPFVQTHTGRSTQGGAGLGLAISRGFVELMGGQIRVRSTPGKGSCFYFTITARLAAAVAMTRTPARVLRIRPGFTPRVLVVEDQPESHRLLVELLSGAGFDVRGAMDGGEAVRVWEEWRPHFIWMDINLPVKDGCQAAREIVAKDTDKQTVIVALTASVFEEDRARIFEAGCVDCLSKPFREESIFECMAKHLGIGYEREHTVAPPAGSESLDKIAASLQALPRDRQVQIRQFTRMLDVEGLARVADDLAVEYPAVAEFLKRSAERLDLDSLDRLMNEAGQPMA